MKLFTIHHQPLAIAVLASAALSACVIAPPQPQPVVYSTYPVYAQPGQPPETVIVGVAPPPAQVEVIPVVPYVGALWVSGFWGWNGGRHYWAPGHYVRPVPGHRFVPHHWTHSGGGRWALRGGHWVR
jgi:hypothetical protein